MLHFRIEFWKAGVLLTVNFLASDLVGGYITKNY